MLINWKAFISKNGNNLNRVQDQNSNMIVVLWQDLKNSQIKKFFVRKQQQKNK